MKKHDFPALKVYVHDWQNYSNPRNVHNSIGNISYIHIEANAWFLFVCGNWQASPLIAAANLPKKIEKFFGMVGNASKCWHLVRTQGPAPFKIGSACPCTLSRCTCKPFRHPIRIGSADSKNKKRFWVIYHCTHRTVPIRGLLKTQK